MKKSMLRLGAAAMHRTGTLRMVQRFSERYQLADGTGIFPEVHRASPRFAILCYHRIGTGGMPYHSAFDTKLFEKQMRYLRRNYRIIGMDQLCQELRDGGPKCQSVALTFDDGYRALYTNAFPVLREYGVPATVFLTAGAIESGEVSWYDRIFAIAMLSNLHTLDLDFLNGQRFPLREGEGRLQAAASMVTALRRCSNEARLAACAELDRRYPLHKAQLKGFMLSWNQIREMQTGGITFGAHTMTHPCVAQLSPWEHHRELVQAKHLIEEKLQAPADHFAFPFGQPSDIGAEACALLPACGYRSAVSAVWGVNTEATNPYLLHRMGGDQPSLPLFAMRLQQLFLRSHRPVKEMQDLDRAVKDIDESSSRARTATQFIEVRHA